MVTNEDYNVIDIDIIDILLLLDIKGSIDLALG